jgi:hypothetical protein
MNISILKDFSEFPGLRHCNISDKSGEEFYHSVLNKAFKEALEKKEQLIVTLDDTAGYASSFLDEAFGNLVYDFTLEVVSQNIEIISEQEPHWKELIEKQTFKEWEQRRKENKQPKITKEHNSWYRLINNQIQEKIWLHVVQ